MIIPSWAQGLGAALASLIAWLWWRGRRASQRADSAERRAEQAEADRDARAAEAIGAARTAEATADQLRADRDATTASGVIADVPTTHDRSADLRAIDTAARRLRDADGASPDRRHGRAPTVPRKRRRSSDD